MVVLPLLGDMLSPILPTMRIFPGAPSDQRARTSHPRVGVDHPRADGAGRLSVIARWARAPRRPQSLAPPFARHGRRVITLESSRRDPWRRQRRTDAGRTFPRQRNREAAGSHTAARTPTRRSHTSDRRQRRRASIAKQGRWPLRIAHAHPCTTGDSAHHSPHSRGLAGRDASKCLKSLASRRGFEPLLPP
jgi:hypothetical protein